MNKRIYHYHTGETLTYRIVVQHLRFGDPFAVFDDLTLEYREHGIAAPEGHDPDPERNRKDFKQIFHFLRFSANSVYFSIFS